MLERYSIERKIEDLRCELNSLTCSNRLTDDIVIQYSEELDELIVQYFNLMTKFCNISSY
ncbi:Spo0E family sporulation regulatory protein-aspartic acid phosphatase [Clostridium sp.]|uniref:Spo0E family sporulation regulatory protein-aspartic acid phosphatase n=1 Tax=Clostridium sp. TaxID=1506 RepID=UPI003464B59D